MSLSKHVAVDTLDNQMLLEQANVFVHDEQKNYARWLWFELP